MKLIQLPNGNWVLPTSIRVTETEKFQHGHKARIEHAVVVCFGNAGSFPFVVSDKAAAVALRDRLAAEANR